ncbi:MAG: SDR family NAD(P)-dependent oxidoreductase [Ilumatobacteraceae bacterium]
MTLLPTPDSIFDLTGKSALVTGATGAFGEQAALALAGAGAHVTIAGANEEKLREVEASITAAGGRAATVTRRPSNEAEVDEIMARACAGGRGIDIVVSGTGTNLVSPIHEQSVKDWDTVMDVNVRQSWLLCRAAGKIMLEQARGGKVILMSSARSTLGMANYSAYCPSKAAIDLLTRSLACEWGPHGIQVNAIAPTVFRSELTGWMFSDEGNGPAVRSNVLRRIPLGRLGEPTDFHGVIQLLASKGSDFMTGAIVHVDGGYTAG